jgi:hypothetical protein
VVVAVESTTQFVRWAIIGVEDATNAEANVMFIANNNTNTDAVFVIIIGTSWPRPLFATARNTRVR